MRLSKYITDNLEIILQEWEEFAASLVPAEQKVDKVLLRDHVKQMLQAIAADLAQPQTTREETEKSKGHNDLSPQEESAASTHGTERLALGFSLNAAMAEYRALRASVTRLWQETLFDTPVPIEVVDDLIRFNEAIDQAINESVTSYSFEKDQQTRVFDTILSSSPDLSFTFDLDGKFTYANKAMIELFELPLDQIVGKNHFDLQLANAEELQREIRQVISSKKQFRGEMPYTPSSGKMGFYEYILVPVLNTDGAVEAVAGTTRNVTERKAVEDQNWQKANYDLLTGLPNRRLFRDRLEQDVLESERTGVQTALLFIDLDHFKEANDSLGHDAGDGLLQLAAAGIRSCVRQTDTVARLGGDEFTVILHSPKNAEQVERVAEKILKNLATPFHVANHTAHLSASIGIAFYPEDADTTDGLIKHADQAMYVSKNAGRNRCSFFSPSQNN